ncbi:polysaccharide deacetylase family protein [uncultured Mucilaginibacter sp.]|uniref:polysaccharide deacetylase family protein n=1 Tax=uncultured Mucilaginibacter sp. TaxID=797541 RepID=UPI00261B5638|nr:polysaccharide deacetylase family protein [uncultured Mucilaginibacter sp.]
MILLSFDIEEFDMPFEYGKTISFEDQLAISTEGTKKILALLKQHEIKATFYCTANYALNKPEIIQKIVADGHEIASHGYYHSDFKVEHLRQSKEALEQLTGLQVSGYRMARMMPVDEREIFKAGYIYNSSVNPTWLPGRYNNFNKPRTWFFKDQVLQLPSSVTPVVRFPLFWLTFHNLPLKLIQWLCYQTYKKDGYLNLYFHPWEFTNLNQPERFNFPNYVVKNTGDSFVDRISNFIGWAKRKKLKFSTTNYFIKTVINK